MRLRGGFGVLHSLKYDKNSIFLQGKKRQVLVTKTGNFCGTIGQRCLYPPNTGHELTQQRRAISRSGTIKPQCFIIGAHF